MNTLLARGQKLFSLRRGAIQAVLSKKSFSAAGVNAVIGVNQRNVQEAVVRIIKTYSYLFIYFYDRARKLC